MTVLISTPSTPLTVRSRDSAAAAAIIDSMSTTPSTASPLFTLPGVTEVDHLPVPLESDTLDRASVPAGGGARWPLTLPS